MIQKVERNKCHICSKTYYIFEPWKKTKAAEAGGYNASSSAELKKKRKKGNTKVERSRELQNSSIPTFFCFDFSGKQSFFFLDVADFSVFICVRPFLRQTFQWFISRSKSRGVNFWVRHDKRGCFLTCVVANRSYYEPPTPLSPTIVC